jgi:hypothetical protein
MYVLMSNQMFVTFTDLVARRREICLTVLKSIVPYTTQVQPFFVPFGSISIHLFQLLQCAILRLESRFALSTCLIETKQSLLFAILDRKRLFHGSGPPPLLEIAPWHIVVFYLILSKRQLLLDL